MLLFFFALLLVVFGAARAFFGAGAGFVALFLVAFEPNFLAHAGIVHTDVPVTLFWLAFVLSWSRLLEKRSAGRIVAAAILLGCALATKFSAVYLIPTAAVVALGVRIAERGEKNRAAGVAGRFLRDILVLALVTGLAVPVVLAIYQPAVSGMGVPDQQKVLGGYLRGGASPRVAGLISAIAPYSRGLAHYLGGAASVAIQSTSGANVNFLNGRISLAGFPWYFFVAFLVKTGPAFLVAVLLSIGLAFARPKDRRDAILWLPTAYYFLFSIGSSYNIGVRHLLPIYPFLAIAASRSVRDLAIVGRRSSRRLSPLFGVVLGAALAGLQLVTAARAHPFELSYFNVLGGGMKGGYRVLADSNVDWGLDLRRLVTEVRRRGIRNPTIVYFGGDDPSYRFVSEPPAGGHPKTELVAISASLWDFGPAYYAVHGRPDLAKRISSLIDRLKREGRPAGRIGGSTFLFELPPEKAP
jgi:4-amino-4-deoxy-L-arabinose transferase-like glycosyltransferase